MEASIIENLEKILIEKEMIYEKDQLEGYVTDASFLTLDLPDIQIFVKNENEAFEVIDFAAKNKIPVAVRARGSGTAGASLSPKGSILLMTELIGVSDRFGNRLYKIIPEIFDKDGNKIENLNDITLREKELYARVGAGLTTEELDRILKPYGWQTAVVPSSGWSAIAGNYATNAGGNGTPTYGTYKDVINRIKFIGTTQEGARTFEITNKDELVKIGGSQGLYGVITELDVRIAPILSDDELLSVVISCEKPDVEDLGETVGAFMAESQENCTMINAEFLFIDETVVKPDDPILTNEEVKHCFNIEKGMKKMLVLYQGKKEKMKNLKMVADKHSSIKYAEISSKTFKKMLDVRKAATGKAGNRINIPGFEDIFLTDPRLLGKVTKKIFELTEGVLPGRPIGHQYIGGLVIHYRPQALVNSEEFQKAWELTQKLTQEIIENPEYKTLKRMEHGLGLELWKLSENEKRKEITQMKEKYDEAKIFNMHLLSEKPEINFAGEKLRALLNI